MSQVVAEQIWHTMCYLLLGENHNLPAYRTGVTLWESIFGNVIMYYSCQNDDCEPKLSTVVKKDTKCECGDPIFNKNAQPFTRLIYFPVLNHIQSLFNNPVFASKMDYYKTPLPENIDYIIGDIIHGKAMVEYVKQEEDECPDKQGKNVYLLVNEDGLSKFVVNLQ